MVSRLHLTHLKKKATYPSKTSRHRYQISCPRAQLSDIAINCVGFLTEQRQGCCWKNQTYSPNGILIMRSFIGGSMTHWRRKKWVIHRTEPSEQHRSFLGGGGVIQFQPENGEQDAGEDRQLADDRRLCWHFRVKILALRGIWCPAWLDTPIRNGGNCKRHSVSACPLHLKLQTSPSFPKVRGSQNGLDWMGS